MKRRLLVTMILVLIVCLVTVVALTGCSDKKEEEDDINAHLKDNQVYDAVKDKLKEMESGEGDMEVITTTKISHGFDDDYMEFIEHTYVVGDKMKTETYIKSYSDNLDSQTTNNKIVSYLYTQDGTGYVATVGSNGTIEKYTMPSKDEYMKSSISRYQVPKDTKFEYDEELDSVYFDVNNNKMGMKVNTRLYFKVVDDKLCCHQVITMSATDPSDPTGETIVEDVQTGDITYISYGKDVPAFDIPQDVLDAKVDGETNGPMLPY